MAESVGVADLKSTTDQLQSKCSVCLQSFNDPKLLQCFHVFCKNCLEPLVLRGQHGLLLHCPIASCNCSTLLPANGISGLQSAFHINHLFEVQDALQKLKQEKEGQKTECGKCKKKEANGFCRDCGKFVCQLCIEMHQIWEEYSTHKVIDLEQLNIMEVIPPTLYCPKHPGKELDLFCETDQELICQHCIVNTHRDHQYNLVSEAYPRHRDTIITYLGPVMQQLNTVNRAIQSLDTTKVNIMEQRAAIESNIQREIRLLHEALEVRNTELIGQLDQMTQHKIKTLSIQKDELVLIQTRLNSCVEFVSDSLKTGSSGEILAMEIPVVQQMKELCADFNTEKLPPQVVPDMVFISSCDILPVCQQFGQVNSSRVCPDKCYATGKGLEVSTVGEQSAVTVNAIDREGSKCSVPLPDAILSCELVLCNGERIKCNIQPSIVDVHMCEVDYCPTKRGRHQLYIKVSDQHIKGSPFKVQVIREIKSPTRIIAGLDYPSGVAINEIGQIIIAERDSHCISIYTPYGEKITSFGFKGSAPGMLKHPCGVEVDKVGNILVVETDNHRIQKFTAEGEFITSVEIKGIKRYSRKDPPSICICPSTNNVFVCDSMKSEVKILNPDLTVHTTFGSGQLSLPWDVAFDSRGNMYVVCFGHDSGIRVFAKNGQYMGWFGIKDRDDVGKKITSPASITIDSDDVVYITEKSTNLVSLLTTEGQFLKSFGTCGDFVCFNRPRGVAVDDNGLVYICDSGNNRVQIW